MDPDHPILRDARLHEVVGLCWDRSTEEPFLDLSLRHTKTSEVKRLRFWSPCDIHVGPDIAAYRYGLTIADVRTRQLEGIGVQVYNFEGFGGIKFFARDVVDMTGAEHHHK